MLGTFLLSGYIGGAVLTHIVGNEAIAPPLIIGVLMFAGSYLRHGTLRKLVPLQDDFDLGPAECITKHNVAD